MDPWALQRASRLHKPRVSLGFWLVAGKMKVSTVVDERGHSYGQYDTFYELKYCEPAFVGDGEQTQRWFTNVDS